MAEVDAKPMEAGNEKFQCGKCDQSLIGQQYILNNEKPFCIGCYDANFTNVCAACSERITSTAKVSITRMRLISTKPRLTYYIFSCAMP